MSAESVPPREWYRELTSPQPGWSPLAGPSALVVDGDWGAGPAPGGDAHRPPVPVIGRLRSPLDAETVPLADACDVLVGDGGSEAPGAVGGGDDAVRRLVDEIEARPLAAALLCQLLRAGGEFDVATGLLAESLAYATLQSGAEHQGWLAGRRPAVGPVDGAPSVVLERLDDVLTIRLDRPSVHNALNTAMRDALVEAFDLVVQDRSITTVRLIGSGPSFCSGGDLAEFATTPDPAVGHAVRSLRLPARALARVADRVRVTVHGSVVGAGVELAAFAWSVEARPETTFRLPEIAMGLVPGAGGTVSLPRRIGRHRTGWLALSGMAVGVDRARAWGLVDRIGG